MTDWIKKGRMIKLFLLLWLGIAACYVVAIIAISQSKEADNPIRCSGLGVVLKREGESIFYSIYKGLSQEGPVLKVMEGEA